MIEEVSISPAELGLVPKPPAKPSTTENPQATPTKSPTPEIRASTLPEVEIFRGLETLGRLADYVIAGTSQPRALQNLVTSLVDSGFPRDRIENTLTAHGIGVKHESTTPTTPPETLLPETEIESLLDKMGRFAEHVKAGTSQPAALQNYVKSLINQGIPNDRIESVLVAHGINVQRDIATENLRAELGQIQSKMEPLMRRLATVFPSLAGGDGRLGDEIPISADELALIKQAIVTSISILDRKPGMASLDALIARNIGNKGFQAAASFGGLMRADPSVNSPEHVVVNQQHTVKLPPALFEMWQAREGLRSAAVMMGFKEYVGPYKGRSARQLRLPLESGIKAALN